MAISKDWTADYKVITPEVTGVEHPENSQGSFGSFNWYSESTNITVNRIEQYKTYEVMDGDVDISLALDTIAEEMTGNSSDQMPLELVVETEIGDTDMSKKISALKVILKKWIDLQDFDTRLFSICRNTIKDGDLFYTKHPKTDRIVLIDPSNIQSAIMDKDCPDRVIAWKMQNGEIISANKLKKFTVESHDLSSGPFGQSILRTVYRAYKQKELVESSIIIYRVQRAPEKRVFKIDTGKMPSNMVPEFLEKVKNEYRQKMTPGYKSGTTSMDTVYDPQAAIEDFWFSKRPDGSGSDVDVLPGGQNLGELTDLYYFQKKVLKRLRIPASYVQGAEEGGATVNDGRLGIMYITELRFSQYIMRLQKNINKVLNEEFKAYCQKFDVDFDSSMIRVELPSPTNFGLYRKIEMDGILLGQFAQADGIQYLSRRFILNRYLGLDPAEIEENERLLRIERGLPPDEEDKASVYSGASQDDDVGVGGTDIGGTANFGGMGGGEPEPPEAPE